MWCNGNPLKLSMCKTNEFVLDHCWPLGVPADCEWHKTNYLHFYTFLNNEGDMKTHLDKKKRLKTQLYGTLQPG